MPSGLLKFGLKINVVFSSESSKVPFRQKAVALVQNWRGSVSFLQFLPGTASSANNSQLVNYPAGTMWA